MSVRIPTEIEVSLYSKPEKVTATLSKCRGRYFYRGMNRNRTYITDDFARQLIESLPYAPIKGIFNMDELDFEDHGYTNSDGKIYGIVPENPNFAWEKHLDKDGIEREYACSDVILFTALYPEANLIPTKPQSMEIYSKDLEGEWMISEEDGEPYFLFKKGRLLGLQVLGDEVEPCFEGAAFFELRKRARDLYHYFEEESKKMENENKVPVENTVTPEAPATVEAPQATEAPTENTVATPEAPTVEAPVAEPEAPAVDNTVVTPETPAEEPKVAEPEAPAEDFAAKYEALVAEFETAKTDFAAKMDELNAKLAEAEEKINSYSKTVEEKEAEIVRLNSALSDINNEKSDLESYKKTVETEEKNKIIDEFSANLSADQIAEFTEKMADYSVEDFRKELCFAAYNSGASFGKTEEPVLIYKNEGSKGEIDAVCALIENHMKREGGNK